MNRSLKQVIIVVTILLGVGLAGYLTKGFVLQSPPSGAWEATGAMAGARTNARAALLADGRVLVTGGESAGAVQSSAELFNADGTFSLAASMAVGRSKHAAVALQDGRILVLGGTGADGNATAAAEIYDPAANAWSSAGAMLQARSGLTATLLPDGRVLIAGGDNAGAANATSEIFDPVSGNFSPAGALSSARTNHAAALLADGRVLIVGGSDGTNVLASSDIFDPAAGAVAPGPALSFARQGHTATTLPDGTVLVAGGSNGQADLNSAEVFDPSVGTFSLAPSAMSVPRTGHLAFLLPHNNSVLMVGGTSSGAAATTAELYVPWTGGFVPTGSPSSARAGAAGSALSLDGALLVAGGNDGSSDLSSSEIYGFATVKTDAADYAPGTTVTITGSGWQPGETVTLTFLESPLIDTPATQQAIADANGNISNNKFSPDMYDVGVKFYLTATGSVSQAQTTFTDKNVTVSCTPTPIANNTATTCTASVAGGTTGAAVNWTSSGTGNFTPSSSCAVNNANPNACSVTYTPTVVGTGTHTITATYAGSGGGSNTFNVGVYGPASKYVVTSNNFSPVAGTSVTITAQLTDAGGNAVPTSGKIVTWSSTNGGSFGSATSATNASGVATVSFTTSSVAGTIHTVTATDNTAVTGTSANITTVAGTVDHFVFNTIGSPQTAGTAFAITISAEDVFNNLATSFSGGGNKVTLTSTGTLTGAPITSPTFASGVLSAFSVTITNTGNFTITATGPGSNPKPTGTSNSFNVVNPDNTPPVVTVSFGIPDGQNSWFVHSPVAGTVSADDTTTGNSNVTAITCLLDGNPLAVGSPSGIGSHAASGTLSVSGDGTHSVSCTATDSAGNSGAGGASSNSATVKIDTTKPTATATPSRATPDHNGWYNHALTIHFSGTDATSGIASCTTDNSYSGPDSATASASGTCTDNAGNVSDSATFSFEYDSTPPSVTLTPDRSADHNGWYNHAVTYTVTGNDATSGGVTCDAPIAYSGPDSGSASATGHCTDAAGNQGSSTTNFKFDSTPPTSVAVNPDRAADHNGWYNHAFTATWTGTDGTSGIDSCTLTNYSGPDTASGSINGTCTDLAGNTSSPAVSFSFKFDSTAPTAALSVTAGTVGTNGWYTSDVTIHTSGSNATSGIESCTADQFQTTETTGATFNGSCTSGAGLTTNASPLVIKLDKTGPTANLAVSAGTLGNAGWYTSNVTISTTGSDNISSPVTCTVDQSLTTDTTGQLFHGSCTNDAGLTTNATDLTVKRDATPPTVNITPDRLADHNTWYNHALTFTNPGTDTTSGIASCTTPAAYSAPDSGAASVSADCTDNAGNVGHGSFNFKYDQTAPTGVSGAPNRAVDHNTWYNHAVDVVFTGTDATSTIDSCSTITYSGPDTAAASVNGTCTDVAGNTSSPVASSTFKFDSTPPSANLAVSAGTPGTHGWYVSDVTVSTSGTDSVSNPTTCSADQFQTAETTGTVFNGSCTNDAGLTANASPLTVKLDKTAPTAVALSVTAGTLGLNGWYTSDVTISTTGTETISNPISCTADQHQTTDTAGQVFHGSCSNDAGLAANASDLTIKRDATPPVLTLVFTPDTPSGQGGWWTNAAGVPFAWTCSDGTSGIDSSYNSGCPSPISGTVTANGTAHFTGQVRDQAGNLSTSVARDLKLDNVAPVIVWNSAGDNCSLVGNAGWCRGTETSAFTSSDPTSGLATPAQASFTQSIGTNGGAITIASGQVCDVAGNCNAGINAGPYKIDSVAPTITLTTPVNGASYTLNAAVAANYTCNDATSGVANCTGNVPNGSNFSTNTIGGKTFTVTATDVAGNPATPVTNSYNVQYLQGGLCLGDLGHSILQPINGDGSSVFKQGSTVPQKFRVCDANGVSIGTAGVVTWYGLVTVTGGTISPTVNELSSDNSTNDLGWRFDPTAQQWIYNLSSKIPPINVPKTTYQFGVQLNDGSWITYIFGLR